MQAANQIPRARLLLKTLDATYRARAVPPGSPRYWSWLFATAELRAPLLGIYALSAEWQALMDPATESSVAQLKLAWWREEMQRLAAGSAVHPISTYLAALPRAAGADFSPLLTAVNAAAAQVGGVPLERGADLEPQSQALWGGPLALASRLAADAADANGARGVGGPHDEAAAAGVARSPGAPGAAGAAGAETVLGCTRALACAEYLSKAIQGYRREARVGRVPFAVDELLAAGIENDDLVADPPPPRLQVYLDGLREQAVRYFESAAQRLPRGQRERHRHLLVLAAIGRAHLKSRVSPGVRRGWKDMLLAWTTARRAH